MLRKEEARNRRSQARFWSSGGQGDSPTDCRMIEGRVGRRRARHLKWNTERACVPMCVQAQAILFARHFSEPAHAGTVACRFASCDGYEGRSK
jgi:hypothetical protein